MTNERDWIREFMSREDINTIEQRAKKVVNSMKTLYEVSLIAPRQSLIQACLAFEAASEGDQLAIAFCIDLLGSLISTFEDALGEDNIDPYGEQ